jgi:hypothetical protein
MDQAQIAKIGLCPRVQSCIQQLQEQVVPAQSLPKKGTPSTCTRSPSGFTRRE